VYIPKHFEVTDENEIFAFVEEIAFGQLIFHLKGQLFSTHIPFLLSADKSRLVGQVALQNPQHTELEGQEVLVTFTDAHDYI
jgi:transcriptional regulator